MTRDTSIGFNRLWVKVKVDFIGLIWTDTYTNLHVVTELFVSLNVAIYYDWILVASGKRTELEAYLQTRGSGGTTY